MSFVDGDGVVVGSPPVSAPPIYDPGGTVCVIDRIVGTNRHRLLDSALAVAFRRGDVLLNVVVGQGDVELGHLVDSRGLNRTVEVLTWR